VFCIFFFSYARECGKGKVFFDGVRPAHMIMTAVLTSFVCFCFFGFWGLAIFFGTGIFTAVLGKFFAGKFNGFTGDVLGAANESTEIFVLLFVLILGGR
jgi:cobalamin synthase